MKKILLAAIALIIMISGCSNKSITSKESGFLDNYDSLQPSPFEVSSMYYITPGTDITSYENIMIEPVKVIANNEELKANTGLIKEMSD